MRKSAGILTALAVVAVAYVAATWYVGKQARAAIEQAVAQANERMAQAMVAQPGADRATMAVVEYRRRIFSSDVVYSLRLRNESGQLQEFLLGDHLQHGPFPWDAVRSGRFVPMLALSQAQLLPSAATQAWFDKLDGKTPVTGRTEVHFGGSAVSDWTFKPLSLAQDGEVLKFSGATMRATFDNDYADSRVTGGFDLLDYSNGEGERMVIDAVRFEYETATEAEATRMNATTQASRLSLELPDESTVSLADAVMKVSSEQNGDLATGFVRYDLGQVRSGDVDLGSLSLGIRGQDISMPAVSELARVYDELVARHGPRQEDWRLSPEEAALLQDRLFALLASNPVVTFEPLVWKNDQGESSASLSLELTRPAQPESAASLDALLQQAVRGLDLGMRIERPMFVRALVQLQDGADDPQIAAFAGELYDNYAQRLQAAGLATLADGAATAKIVYRDGQVDANGKKMPVAEFMQRALLVLLM